MPYGAPELLEGAAPRMARSTLVASGLVALMVCAFGLIAAKQPASIELTPDVIRKFVLEPQPNAPQEPHAREFVQPQPISEPREFLPVLDELDQKPSDVPIDVPGPVGPLTPGKAGEPDAVPDRADYGLPPPPQPGVFVWTDEMPQLVKGVKPDYPDLAREAGVEGTVKLQLLIGLDGHVMRALVRPGGSVPMLDEAAIAAAMKTVFTPALANHRPVMVWVTQDYRFTLH
jgi:TonB family protein